MATSVTRLLLVYNADWSLVGGIRYAAQKLRGVEECVLCEITHDGLSEKTTWQSCKVTYGVPVDGVYKNQLDARGREACGDAYPCVLAETDSDLVQLLNASELEACEGDPDRLHAALTTALAQRGLAVKGS